MEMLDEKAFFTTINWVATRSLQTYGMAVVIFNKNVAGFKGIQNKIPNIFESHKQYVQSSQSSHAGEWRYVLKSSDDENRKIAVHVFLFNLYVDA